MKVDWYTQIGQFLIIPTVKVTFDRTLNGSYEIIFAWGAWGIAIQF